MRTSKSILAGVAAGALALGALTVAGATSASAAPSIKPKADVSAVVSPVRVTVTGSAVDGVPYASLSWTSSNTLANTDTVVLSIVDAPSPASRIAVATTANIGANATISSGNFTNALGTATGYGLGSAQMAAAGVVPAYTVAANATASIGVAANEAGNYSGTLTSYRGGVALDTVSWAFTTTGKAASMAIAPASQNVAVNGTATLAVTLKDSSGKTTQPLVVDGITTSVSPTGNGTPGSVTTTGSGSSSLYDGVAAFTFTPTAAGGYAVTATPTGTLPAGGVTAQSASVTAATTATFTGINIAAPTKGVSTSNTVYTAPTALTPVAASTVYASTTVKDITWGIVGTAGSLVAYSVTDDATNPAGVTSGAGTVAIGADGVGTVTISATAPAPNAQYVLSVGPPAGAQVTYTVAYRATGALNVSNLKTVPAASTTTYVKTGEAQGVVATMTDQFGLPLAGVTVTSAPSVSASVSAVTGADGKATLSVPGPAASVTSQTVTFTATALGGSAGPTPALTLIYNSSGAPTSLTASSTAGTVAATALATQYVDTAGNKVGTWATTSVTTETQWMQVSATVGGGVSGVPVIFSGKDLYFAASNAAALSDGDKEEYITATAGGVASVFVKATKTGTATVTMQAGTLTTDIKWSVANQAADARVIAVTPATQESGSPAQVKATVTDAFGNTVANAALNFAEEGVGNFATGTSTLTTATGPNGSVVVDVISTQSGDSLVTVAAGATANYAGAADSPVTGAPKGVSSGVGAIKFGAGSKSITITGSRTTVGGKPGIKIDGAVTGIDNGKTVVPYFRFPGETTFSQGTARPVISGGKFTWERKTGKKFYAYVTSDDGKVTSNRVIIAAN